MPTSSQDDESRFIYRAETLLTFIQDGSFQYAKVYFIPNGGSENLKPANAVRIDGEDPDYHVNDLFHDVEKKIWPRGNYPLQLLGKLTLNRNRTNYFQDVE
ncbi:catalase [Calycina marina]|uniref:Catalase n=1 Tax=Calycina marina TaxID=1763456 RepID=A0A9P8CC99_9HELO|nr:catalase [Calycina marina]